MLAIKIFPLPSPSLQPVPPPPHWSRANRWTVDCGSSSCGLSCQLCRHLAVARRNKIKVQIFHICGISCGSLAAERVPPSPSPTSAAAPQSTLLLTLLTWRHQDIHFILTIAALCCCRRCRCRGLWQDLIHLVGGTTGDGASSCGQQQQTNQNPNRYQIVGFVAFANHRETLRVWLQL